MKKWLATMLGVAVLAGFAPSAPAQHLDDVFRKASPTVVVVRAKGRDVTAAGITRYTETGSGGLISSDGRVMTAAHVVNGKDEITVEGIGGEVVHAKLLSANTAADVSLLQLERVTRAMRVARIGNSDAVQVGEQVMVVGAPLFNMSGDVIGIVSQNITKGGGSEGLGFVVTTKSAQDLLVPRKIFWGALQGMLLTGGDIILSVEGVDVVSEDNIEQIRNRLASLAPGAAFKMTGLRGGKIVELTGAAE